MQPLVYLDNNATTELDIRVLDAMLPFLKELYGNPASSHHFGNQIAKAIDIAREKVASLLNAKAKQIIFTAGATEAINLAIKGLALSHANRRRQIVTLKTEHKAVLDTCASLEGIGFEVTYLPVKHDGLLDIEVLKSNISEETFLVAVMLANNETGVLQDIKSITNVVHENGTYMMTDATQAVGKIPVDALDLDVDFMALSAHKMYGPKGSGALYVKDSQNRLTPILHGGGHESGLRSGTLNTSAIVGFGTASAIAYKEMAEYHQQIKFLRDTFEINLLKIPNSKINGSTSNRLYNVTNICFQEFDANAFIGRNKSIAVSNGSACTSAVFEPSHVLLSMGLSPNEALGSLRFSLGKFSTLKDIEVATKVINNEFATTS